MSDPASLSFAGWTGWLRPDGRKGIRNLVLVLYTVECAQHVAHLIAAGEDDVHVVGFPGCYDNAYAIRLLLALAYELEAAAPWAGIRPDTAWLTGIA